MAIHLVNPANHSFGIATITPRWLYVLAGATPGIYGDPILTDEATAPIDIDRIDAHDVVGIGIHTSNALRGYEIGRAAAARGATVIFGGIHATLYPDEVLAEGNASAVVKGDGEVVWAEVLRDRAAGTLRRVYDGGRVEPDRLTPARWDLLPPDQYLVGCVQTVRGCPKHCSFCSVWRTDGQRPRQRGYEAVIEEILELRRRGFRFVLLADDNFYPVTLADLARARERGDTQQLAQLTAIRDARFDLLKAMADELPPDMLFFTQITMEASEDIEFLTAMNRAHVRFVLVGVETVTTDGLKAIRKNFNSAGDELVDRLRVFSQHGVNVLASFIFGLPTDKPDTFDATLDVAARANVAFAQFVRLTPFPGTVDFAHWEKNIRATQPREADVLTRYWLVPMSLRPKVQVAHPTMSSEEILERTRYVWTRFYSWSAIWRRSTVVGTIRARIAFVIASKLFAQMYFHTGVASDSARASRSAWWAGRLTALSRRIMINYKVPGTV